MSKLNKLVKFKNGDSIKIHEAAANVIYDNICKGTYKTFECFKDENGNFLYIINITEIQSIHGFESVQ